MQEGILKRFSANVAIDSGLRLANFSKVLSFFVALHVN